MSEPTDSDEDAAAADGTGTDASATGATAAAAGHGDVDVTVDAREVAGEPFGTIVAALEDLGPDERLLLVNSFEPEPLYDVLDERGFAFETTRAADDEWHVVVEHAG